MIERRALYRKAGVSCLTGCGTFRLPDQAARAFASRRAKPFERP